MPSRSTTILAVWLLLGGVAPAFAQDAPDALPAVAQRLVQAGAQLDAPVLRAGLAALDDVDGAAHLVAYWRGYAHWRLAQVAAAGTGNAVQRHVDAAVAALETAVHANARFPDGWALLATANDWQMAFDHANKGRYARRTNECLGRAAKLDPDHPRVLLAQGWDLLRTPAQYGGDPRQAIVKFEQARDRLSDEPAPDVAGTPRWGPLDTHLALAEAHVTLGDLARAQASYEAALALEPKAPTAKRGLQEVAVQLRVREPAILADAPIPAPLDNADTIRGWPRWRGPARNGASAEHAWTTTGTERWRVAVGLGYSGPAIADGRLITKGYDVDAAEDVVRALDADTGAELWQHRAAAALWNEMHDGGTLSTPTVDDDRVYSLNREGLVHCLAAMDGRVLWQRQLVDEEAVCPSRWGFAASPLVLGRQLILNVGRVVSLDKHTGERLWRTRSYGDAYSTPTPFRHADAPRLAVFVAEGLVVLDPRTGAELAAHGWKTTYDQNCASPLILDGDVFISSGMNRGAARLRFDGDGLTPVWANKAMRNTMTGSVRHGEALYGIDHRTLRCVGIDGTAHWRQRGIGWGALTLAGDRLIVLTEDGELLIAAASTDSYDELHRERVFEPGNHCWTAPILVDGRLYLRNSAGQLCCRDHRQGAAPTGR
ncbi:MAG: PQQ-binding-like beta-propeller repeat protein [Planctomycetota bacterium]